MYICISNKANNIKTNIMTTFYNETSLNGKFQIMTTEELNGKGIKKVCSNSITTHKGDIYKNLNKYWVSKDVFNTIKEDNNAERAYF
jgi:hypothetical protein